MNTPPQYKHATLEGVRILQGKDGVEELQLKRYLRKRIAPKETVRAVFERQFRRSLMFLVKEMKLRKEALTVTSDPNNKCVYRYKLNETAEVATPKAKKSRPGTVRFRRDKKHYPSKEFVDSDSSSSETECSRREEAGTPVKIRQDVKKQVNGAKQAQASVRALKREAKRFKQAQEALRTLETRAACFKKAQEPLKGLEMEAERLKQAREVLRTLKWEAEHFKQVQVNLSSVEREVEHFNRAQKTLWILGKGARHFKHLTTGSFERAVENFKQARGALSMLEQVAEHFKQARAALRTLQRDIESFKQARETLRALERGAECLGRKQKQTLKKLKQIASN